ncbi:MAG: TatD family hydrolase [Oscillospiraceae bacterium]|nr:TatD family hydrolase [Oscillospiraceae bacterium]
MFFDTHAHYDDRHFDSDRDELLPALAAAGVELIVDPGCDTESSRAALALAERWPFVYAAVGVHPEEMAHDPCELGVIRELARHPKCVAIGEVGLDYYWDREHKAEQQKLFRAQIELAMELGKPVIVHDRDAHGDCLAIARDYPGARGVFHCFSGSLEMAEELLALGWYLGFDGPITYKNARRALEVLALCPPERILMETDSPYLSPEPLRGRRNDSRNLVCVAEKIGELKGLTAAEAARLCLENGRRLFGLEAAP